MNQAILSGRVAKTAGITPQHYSYNFNMVVSRPERRSQATYDKNCDLFLVNAYDSAAMYLDKKGLEVGDEVVIKGWLRVVEKKNTDGKTVFSSYLTVDNHQDIISIVKGKSANNYGNYADEPDVIFESIDDARK